MHKWLANVVSYNHVTSLHIWIISDKDTSLSWSQIKYL